MKKLTLLLALAITLIACEGPQGPPGVNVVAQSFETLPTDFIGPRYEALFDFPPQIEVFPDDMVLVYILWEDTDEFGNPIDIWRLLPQVLYTDVGEFQYNYDHTSADVRIFLDAPDRATLDNLLPADLFGQIFRVVILPNELATGDLDVTDYEAVMQHGGLEVNDIQVIE